MATAKFISQVRRAVSQLEKKLASVEKAEVKARAAWQRGYQRFLKAAETLATLTRHGTKKEQRLQQTVSSWRDDDLELSSRLELCRSRLVAAKSELQAKREELERVLADDREEIRRVDDIVDTTFSLNQVVVEASAKRADHLTQRVFKLLVGEDGKLRAQITLDHSDGTRRVRAMVNTITVVKTDQADEALDLIQRFFDKFTTIDMDVPTRSLFELTRRVLLLKASFKVGPDFYRFLVMDLDETLFPDLVMAQNLLKQSLRSEKTGSYVRLYQREDRNSPWEAIPQH